MNGSRAIMPGQLSRLDNQSRRQRKVFSMSVGSKGYRVIDLPPVSDEILDSYDDCPLDEFMGDGTRFKRFSQYKLSWREGEGWVFDLLPHRDYTAFKEFNPVGGGKRRPYEPVKVDFTSIIRAAADEFPLDRSADWQINVHQNRTQAVAGKPGPLTPEGVHQDGHEYVLIAVLRRNNVDGARTRLWRLGAPAPFWAGTLDAGQAVLLDDRAIAHDVTDLVSANGGPGHRDILITAFSRWTEKWYGDEHDAAALADEGTA